MEIPGEYEDLISDWRALVCTQCIYMLIGTMQHSEHVFETHFSLSDEFEETVLEWLNVLVELRGRSLG